MADKPHLNLVFIGHVDHGKSTLVGRTLLDTGHIEKYLIDKFRKEAEERGKGGFEFAYVMDGLKEERERGVTIDVAHKRFDTKKYYFTIIDAPGHRDFVKNMITGTSQADAAVLVVAANDGVMAQTKEHVFLARTLGVEQLVIAVNKMDMKGVEFSEKRFEEVKKDVTNLLKLVNFNMKKVQFCPTSALMGHNITKPSADMSWSKADPLVVCLDNLEVPAKPTNLPLRLPVQDVYTITGVGTVPVGRIETGIMKPGDSVIFVPSKRPGGAIGEVKTIEMHHEHIPIAEPGDNVGFNVRGIGKKDIRRGDVCGAKDDPPSLISSKQTFDAQIAVLQHPSAITVGYTPVFHAHTAQIACQFEELTIKIDPKTGGIKEKNPTVLRTGDIAKVKIRPTRPMVLEKDIKQLSRFAIRDMGTTVAAGVCMNINPRDM